MPTDLSSEVQSALNSQGYCKVTGTVALNNINVPDYGCLDARGATIHVSPSSRNAVTLGRRGSLYGGNFVCDIPGSTTWTTVNPSLVPASLPVGVVCTTGASVRDPAFSWFSTGVVNAVANASNVAAQESLIERVTVTNPIYSGISWTGSSDFFIVSCVVARPCGPVQNATGEWVGLAPCGIDVAGGGGYLRDCHVWGGFSTGVEIGSPDCLACGLTIEGSWETLLLLNAYRVQVRDAFLFFPNSGATTTAIEFGSPGSDCSACNVSARIGPLGGYGYKALATTNNSALGNILTLDFMGSGVQGSLTPGHGDVWTAKP